MQAWFDRGDDIVVGTVRYDGVVGTVRYQRKTTIVGDEHVCDVWRTAKMVKGRRGRGEQALRAEEGERVSLRFIHISFALSTHLTLSALTMVFSHCVFVGYSDTSTPCVAPRCACHGARVRATIVALRGRQQVAAHRLHSQTAAAVLLQYYCCGAAAVLLLLLLRRWWWCCCC